MNSYCSIHDDPHRPKVKGGRCSARQGVRKGKRKCWASGPWTVGELVGYNTTSSFYFLINGAIISCQWHPGDVGSYMQMKLRVMRPARGKAQSGKRFGVQGTPPINKGIGPGLAGVPQIDAPRSRTQAIQSEDQTRELHEPLHDAKNTLIAARVKVKLKLRRPRGILSVMNLMWMPPSVL